MRKIDLLNTAIQELRYKPNIIINSIRIDCLTMREIVNDFNSHFRLDFVNLKYDGIEIFTCPSLLEDGFNINLECSTCENNIQYHPITPTISNCICSDREHPKKNIKNATYNFPKLNSSNSDEPIYFSITDYQHYLAQRKDKTVPFFFK
jgi:hypothetical protein